MIEFLVQLLSLGVIPGVLCSGYVFLSKLCLGWETKASPATRIFLPVAFGFLLWSVPLVVLPLWGWYNSWGLGLAGWIIAGIWGPLVVGRASWLRGYQMSMYGWGVLLVALITFISGLLFYTESMHGGIDQGVYAAQAKNIYLTGEIFKPYPMDGLDGHRYREFVALMNKSGLYATKGEMTVQFSPLYPAWMAQFYGIFGHFGLFVFNVCLASLNVFLFYGLVRLYASRFFALVSLLIFALNISQIWIARITLSEVFAQTFIISGFLALGISQKCNMRRLAYVGVLFLGGSFFVRIDGLLILPLYMCGLLTYLVLVHHDGEKSVLMKSMHMGGMLGTLLVVFGGGVWFYYLSSNPYLQALLPTLKLALYASGVVLPFCLVVRKPSISSFLQKIVSRKLVWMAPALIVVGLAFYGYFFRPYIEPFATWDRGRLMDTRTFQEDSLQYIGQYLSLPVLGLAVVGTCAILNRIFRLGKDIHITIFFVIWLGYTFVYCYNPNISPYHIWGSRRFLPLIFPGFALIAAIGLQWICSHWNLQMNRKRWAIPILSFFIGYYAWAGWPLSVTQELKGTVAFFKEIRNKIEKDSLVFFSATTRFFEPLYLGENLRVIRFDMNNPRHIELANEIIANDVKGGDSFYLLTNSAIDILFESVEKVTIPYEYTYIKSRSKPLGWEKDKSRFQLHLLKMRGSFRLPNSRYDNFTIGHQKIEGIDEEGFFQDEYADGQFFRWTTGTASLSFPMEKEYRPEAMSLSIIGFKAGGCRLRVSYNDRVIYDDVLTIEHTILDLDIPEDMPSSDRGTIQFVTETFKPSDYNGSTDNRDLGIRIKGLRIFGSTQVP